MVSTPEAGQPALTENHEPKQANWVAAGRIDRRGARLGLLRRPATVGYARNFRRVDRQPDGARTYKPYVAGVTLRCSATASGMSISSRNRPVKTVPTALVHNRLGPPRRCCGWALPSPSWRSPSTVGTLVLLRKYP
jgi:hypothetical protein